jgi:hypothetical protein
MAQAQQQCHIISSTYLTFTFNNEHIICAADFSNFLLSFEISSAEDMASFPLTTGSH